MASDHLFTASQLVEQGAASARGGVLALVAAGDLHPEGVAYARYRAAEVKRLMNMSALAFDAPAALVRVGPWLPEDGTVFAGRCGHGFRASMTWKELGDSSRGVWRVNPARFYRAGLLIPVHLGITRGAFRIVGPGPIPVGSRWAVEVEPLDYGGPEDRSLSTQIIGRRVVAPARTPVQFVNGA